jgi:hypothetical protein
MIARQWWVAEEWPVAVRYLRSPLAALIAALALVFALEAAIGARGAVPAPMGPWNTTVVPAACEACQALNPEKP